MSMNFCAFNMKCLVVLLLKIIVTLCCAHKNSVTYTAKRLCPTAPNSVVLKNNRPDKTWSEMTWNMDFCRDCMKTLVSVDCKAPKETNTYQPWTVRSRKITGEYSSCDLSNNNLPPPINITDLSEFTNYTCYVTTKNVGKMRSKTMVLNFQTQENVPSTPVGLRVTDIKNAGFLITWEKPSKVPGMLMKYKISITPIKPSLYIAPDCKIDWMNVSQELSPDDTSFYLSQTFPNKEYLVKVRAATRVGYGSATETIVKTDPSSPEPPRYVSYHVSNMLGDDYNVFVSLYWHVPCNANGIISHYKVNILGVSLVQGEPDERTEILGAANSRSVTAYKYNIEHIRPSYNYSVKINVVLLDNTEGLSKEVNFVSPDGYPSAPNMTNVIADGNSIYISWDEPKIKNGNLRFYRLIFTAEDCRESEDCDQEADEILYDVPANETSFTFDKGLPNRNYSVRISAATNAGYGPDSDSMEIQMMDEGMEFDLPLTIGLVFGVALLTLPFGLYACCAIRNKRSNKRITSVLGPSFFNVSRTVKSESQQTTETITMM